MVWCTARSPGAAHSLITQGPSMDPPWMRPPAQLTDTTPRGHRQNVSWGDRLNKNTPMQESWHTHFLTLQLCSGHGYLRRLRQVLPWFAFWKSPQEEAIKASVGCEGDFIPTRRLDRVRLRCLPSHWHCFFGYEVNMQFLLITSLSKKVQQSRLDTVSTFFAKTQLKCAQAQKTRCPKQKPWLGGDWATADGGGGGGVLFNWARGRTTPWEKAEEEQNEEEVPSKNNWIVQDQFGRRGFWRVLHGGIVGTVCPFVLIVIELSERCEYNILWSKSLRPTLAETGTSTPESHCLEIDQIPFADVSSIRIKAAQIKASMGRFTWKAPGLKSRPWRLCRRSSALSLSAQFGEPGNENLTICRTKTHLKWQRHNMLA